MSSGTKALTVSQYRRYVYRALSVVLQEDFDNGGWTTEHPYTGADIVEGSVDERRMEKAIESIISRLRRLGAEP